MGNQNGKPKVKILRTSLKSSEEGFPRRGKRDKEKEKEKEKEKDKEKGKDTDKDKKLDTVVVEGGDDEEEDSDEQDELGDEQEFIPSNTVDNDILIIMFLFNHYTSGKSILMLL